MPYRMADYAQQSRRAGRDRQRSEAIVIRLNAQGGSRRPRPLVSEHVATDNYISGDVCRRVVLDSIMDGRGDREGCEEGEELCDICQRRAVEENVEAESGRMEDMEEVHMRERELEVEGARYRAMALVAEAQEGFRDYRRKLAEQALDGCIFCTVQHSDDRAHSGLRCE
jgi:superfamily II DNA helicase RecQ